MDGAQSKLYTSVDRKTPFTDLEQQVAKALFDIQNANSDLAADLGFLKIRGAREVEMDNRKAILVLVPSVQIKAWRRIQSRVVRELEKKLGGGGERSVVLIAYRRMTPKPTKARRGTSVSSKTVRPRHTTLTAVHDAWLEDMVYPTEIVGKHERVKKDGSRLIKVFLDSKDQTVLEGKTDVLSGVYRKLTGKNVVFEFPVIAAGQE